VEDEKDKGENFNPYKWGVPMKKVALLALLITPLFDQIAIGVSAKISENTQTCIDCHASLHPGIIAGWENSRHAKNTPA